MATWYVNAAAAGAGTGTSKTDAYTTLAALLTAQTLATGDEVWIAHTHTETASAALSEIVQGSGTNRGVRYRGMNFATDTPTAGAVFTMGANAVILYGLVEDLEFTSAGSAVDMTISTANFVEYVGCTFRKQAAQKFIISGSQAGRGIIRDSEFACGTSYTFGFATTASQAEWEFHRNTISGTKGTNASLFQQVSSAQTQRVFWQGSDLSGWDNVVDHATGAANGALDITLSGCQIPASWEIEDGAGNALLRKGARVTLINCASGTLTVPVWQGAYYSHYGSAVLVSDRYRANGAYDQATRYSFEMTALANRTWTRSRHAAVAPLGFVGWVAAGTAITVTAYVAHNAVGAGTAGALTDAECGLRIYGPSDAGSPVAKQYSATTISARSATAADLTTDSSSTWTGSSLGTKQKMSLTYTPTIAGPVFAEVVFCPGASSDKTIYLDAVATVA